jgi:hypothetical protein
MMFPTSSAAASLSQAHLGLLLGAVAAAPRLAARVAAAPRRRATGVCTLPPQQGLRLLHRDDSFEFIIQALDCMFVYNVRRVSRRSLWVKKVKHS